MGQGDQLQRNGSLQLLPQRPQRLDAYQAYSEIDVHVGPDGRRAISDGHLDLPSSPTPSVLEAKVLLGLLHAPEGFRKGPRAIHGPRAYHPLVEVHVGVHETGDRHTAFKIDGLRTPRVDPFCGGSDPGDLPPLQAEVHEPSLPLHPGASEEVMREAQLRRSLRDFPVAFSRYFHSMMVSSAPETSVLVMPSGLAVRVSAAAFS